MRTRTAIIGALAISAAGLTGCADDPSATQPLGATDSISLTDDAERRPDESGNTILDIALGLSTADVPEFTTLVAAVLAADPAVAADLGAKGQRTVFAPTDAAFQALFENPSFPYTPEELLGNTELLTTVLLYHVSPGQRFAADILESDRVRMKAGGFTFPQLDGDVFLRDTSDITPNAEIVMTDIEASNGVIHVIDRVLLP